MSDWGQGAKNNDIGWGQGAVNNDISWGASHKVSWAGDTEIVGTDGDAPVNTIAPVISGTALVGNTLTSTTGTWTSDTGVIGYLYQWYREATLISGATNSTYVLTLSDAGFNMTCRVAATDTDGTSAYVSSNSILAIDTRLIFSVKTDNAGTSASNQFTIPTLGTGYLYDIETSDGQSITGRTGSTTITFPSAGTYDIFISGSFPQFSFNNVGDRMKLLNLKNFGIYALGSTNQDSAFYGCSNMVISATDTGHFENIDRFFNIFRACTSITTFPFINFSKSVTFLRAWQDCINLTNFPANAFDTAICSVYTLAFTNTKLSTQSIDNILVSIDTSGVTNGTLNQSGGSNLPSATGLTAKANLISKGWTVTTN